MWFFKRKKKPEPENKSLNNPIHGVIEFELNGVKRGLMFGPYGYMISCREDGTKYSEFLQKVNNGEDELASLHFIYGAAVFYCRENNTPIDFNPPDVLSWMNELGTEKLKQIVQEAFKAPEKPKNSLSPKETGMSVQ